METIELIFVTDVNAWIYLHNKPLLLRESLSLQSKALAKAAEVGRRPDRKTISCECWSNGEETIAGINNAEIGT